MVPGWSFHSKQLAMFPKEGGCLTTIGSSNMSGRSWKRDSELTCIVWIEGKDGDAVIMEEIDRVLKQTKDFDEKSVKKGGPFTWLKDIIINILNVF